MKPTMLVYLILLLHSNCLAQNTTIEKFLGNWKGQMEWSRPGKSTQRYSMQLTIDRTDSANQYSWIIHYGDSAKDIRPYTLKLMNATTGNWVIDENNGIVLDNYLLANCLTGSFTVMGNTITDSYCLENGKLKVMFVSMKLADKKTSGKGTDDSPSVDSYRITGIQQGLLEKQSK